MKFVVPWHRNNPGRAKHKADVETESGLTGRLLPADRAERTSVGSPHATERAHKIVRPTTDVTVPPAPGHRVPARIRWAPIVIDSAIAEFEPKPAGGRQYQPDTIVDGWSTDHFVVRLASVRGYSHRFYGKPRQDDAIVVAHPPTESVVFAVADGVSGACWSEVGAQVVCRTAVDLIRTMLDTHPGGPDWLGLAKATSVALLQRAHLQGCSPAEDYARAEDRYATTLVTGYVWPTRDGPHATMIQIGDSGAWLLNEERYINVLRPKTAADAAVFSSQVAALPALPNQIEPVNVALGTGSILLVGTDGIGDPLGDGTGLVGDHFRSVLSQPPPPLNMAHAVDFSRETFDDDRTLLAVWPRS